MVLGIFVFRQWTETGRTTNLLSPLSACRSEQKSPTHTCSAVPKLSIQVMSQSSPVWTVTSSLRALYALEVLKPLFSHHTVTFFSSPQASRKSFRMLWLLFSGTSGSDLLSWGPRQRPETRDKKNLPTSCLRSLHRSLHITNNNTLSHHFLRRRPPVSQFMVLGIFVNRHRTKTGRTYQPPVSALCM